ncbi:MAG: GNAT family N-acetyltransferase [Pseudomonadota bacterium]
MSPLAFNTARLRVGPWRDLAEAALDRPLNAIVAETLTARVTAALPPGWQGAYDGVRADRWISEREGECTCLLGVDRECAQPVALVLLFPESTRSLRLGYLLHERSWGQGYATELIRGLIAACHDAGIDRVSGGVAPENAASARVLEKAGFVEQPMSAADAERLFVWTAP